MVHHVQDRERLFHSCIYKSLFCDLEANGAVKYVKFDKIVIRKEG